MSVADTKIDFEMISKNEKEFKASHLRRTPSFTFDLVGLRKGAILMDKTGTPVCKVAERPQFVKQSNKVISLLETSKGEEFPSIDSFHQEWKGVKKGNGWDALYVRIRGELLTLHKLWSMFPDITQESLSAKAESVKREKQERENAPKRERKQRVSIEEQVAAALLQQKKDTFNSLLKAGIDEQTARTASGL